MTRRKFPRHVLTSNRGRRAVYREAKRHLIEHLRRQSVEPIRRIERRVRIALRGQARGLLIRIARNTAFASIVAGALVCDSRALAEPPVYLSDVSEGIGGFPINGEVPDDHSGRSVSNAGDVNGDGREDLIVGAYLAGSLSLDASGKAYVIFGDPEISAIYLSQIDSGSGGFVIRGNYGSGFAGRSVSGGGDVNGDGLDDVIVGVPENGSSGEVYVVFGKTGTAAVLLDSLGANGFAINGAMVNGDAGFSVSGAGDVNGDAFDDLIVGAYRANSQGEFLAGKAYVVFGKPTTSAIELSTVQNGAGGFVIEGDGVVEFTGYSVSGAGDVNDDGKDDLIVGVPNSLVHDGYASGQVYVVFGKATTGLVDVGDLELGIGGFVINGLFGGGAAGVSVSGIGDMNGDGMADIAIGAPYASFSGIDPAAFVIFGKTTTSPVSLDEVVASGLGGFAISGNAAENRAGFSVSDAGDVNADGLPDLLVGAPDAAIGLSDAIGHTYVIYGTQSTELIDLGDIEAGIGGFVIYGVAEGDESGTSVAAAGDFNDDCLCDVLVGAPLADPSELVDAGQSYVVFSPAAPNLQLNVWVDFTYTGASDGTASAPYPSIKESLCFVDDGGTITLFPGSTPEVLTINRALTLRSEEGTAAIGVVSERESQTISELSHR